LTHGPFPHIIWRKRRALLVRARRFGAPMLLLVSVAAVSVSVAAIILVGITGAGWAVVMALTAALVATTVVIGFIARMLGEADHAGR
jgi:uncharacterized membrane protein